MNVLASIERRWRGHLMAPADYTAASSRLVPHADVGFGFNLPSSDKLLICRALNLPKGWAGVDLRWSAVSFTLASGPDGGRPSIWHESNQFSRIRYLRKFNEYLALTSGVLRNLCVSVWQLRLDLLTHPATAGDNRWFLWRTAAPLDDTDPTSDNEFLGFDVSQRNCISRLSFWVSNENTTTPDCSLAS